MSGSGATCKRIFRTGSERRVTIRVDGDPVEAVEGETLLAAIMVSRGWAIRRTEVEGEPRGMFCGMGVCQECLVRLEGSGVVRACMTLVEEGMVVKTLGEGTERGSW